MRGPGCVYEIQIPDGVEELREKCFSLSRVTFGESSSLKSIGKEAFSGSGVVEIHIPDGIRPLLADRGFAPLASGKNKRKDAIS